MTEEILAVIIVPYVTAFKGKHTCNMRMYKFSDVFFKVSNLRFWEKEHAFLIISRTPCGKSAPPTEQM